MENFGEALGTIFSGSGLLAIMAGVAVGMVVGILPGMGQGVALLLTLPIVLTYPPEIALIVYASLLGATDFGGSITSCILGIPGTSQNLTTLMDGYPMSKSGHAGRAIGLSAFSSLIGALLGMLTVILLLPFVKILIYVYGSREYFLTIVLAAVIVSIVNLEFFKGLVSFCLGSLISLIGTDLVFAMTRYTGGVFYLRGKISIAVFIIGLFAMTGMIILQSEGKSIAGDKIIHATYKDTFMSFIEVVKNWRVVIPSAVIGVVVGIIPGIGGEVAQFISYGFRKLVARDKSKFGKGDPTGVIASEASNSAKDSGALLPTLCLGIPGAPEMAILLGILMIIGITPGPGMMKEHSGLLWLVLVSAMCGVIVAAIISIFGSPYLSRITKIPINYVFALTLPLAFAAAYAWSSNVWDCVMLGVFCLAGLLLTRSTYPVPSLILGFVLGPLAENSFHTTLQSGYYNPLIFFQSSTALVLIALIVLCIVAPIIYRAARKRPKEEAPVNDEPDRHSAGHIEGIVVIAAIMLLAVLAMIWAPKYNLSRSGLFPMFLTIVLTLAALIVLVSELKKYFAYKKTLSLAGGAPVSVSESGAGAAELPGDETPADVKEKVSNSWKQYFPALVFLFAYIVLVVLFGMYVAAFVAFSAYFKLFSKEKILKSLICGLVITAFLFLLFNVIFGVRLWPGSIPLVFPGFLGGGILRPFF